MKKLSYKDGEEEELLSKRYTHTQHSQSFASDTYKPFQFQGPFELRSDKAEGESCHT